MEQPVLQAKSLYFSYDGKGNALDGVSLNIYAGERIAVLGPNGAGKSTFFLCLNGVLTPERGEILLDGEPVGKKTRKRLCERAGIVFQNADDQIIASTVAAEVSFGPMNLRLPKDEVVRRVDHALDYMDLQAFRERPPQCRLAHAVLVGERLLRREDGARRQAADALLELSEKGMENRFPRHVHSSSYLFLR